jgi:hypothetical protein
MEAMNVTNSDGVRYGDIPSDKLSNMTRGINLGLNKPDLTNEKQSEYLNKLNAIKTILEYRNQGVAA